MKKLMGKLKFKVIPDFPRGAKPSPRGANSSPRGAAGPVAPLYSTPMLLYYTIKIIA